MIGPTKISIPKQRKNRVAALHCHICMNAFDGSIHVTQGTIHDCLGTEELPFANDSVRLEIRDLETRPPYQEEMEHERQIRS